MALPSTFQTAPGHARVVGVEAAREQAQQRGLFLREVVALRGIVDQRAVVLDRDPDLGPRAVRRVLRDVGHETAVGGRGDDVDVHRAARLGRADGEVAVGRAVRADARRARPRAARRPPRARRTGAVAGQRAQRLGRRGPGLRRERRGDRRAATRAREPKPTVRAFRRRVRPREALATPGAVRSRVRQAWRNHADRALPRPLPRRHRAGRDPDGPQPTPSTRARCARRSTGASRRARPGSSRPARSASSSTSRTTSAAGCSR